MNDKSYGRFNGPAKHVPQKPKGPVRLFLELWWANIWDLIPMNVMYSMLNLLLLPHGFVSTGITNVTRNLARDKHTFGLSDFFETARKNWKQGLAAGLINIFMTALLIFGTWFYFTSEGFLARLGMGVCLIALAIFSFMKYYIWLIIITFKLPLKSVYRNAFYLAFLNFKNNMIVGLVSLAYYALILGIFLLLPYALTVSLEFMLTVLFFPGFKHLLVQYCVFPSVKKHMIDPYYEEHPEEDIEMRKDLHVIKEE